MLAVPLLVVYLWPTFARSAERRDVVVVGDGAVVAASDELGRHLRERGLRSEVVLDVDPCDADAAERAIAGAHAVVVSFTGSTIDRCRDAVMQFVSSLDDPIVVRQDAGGLVEAASTRRCSSPRVPMPASAVSGGNRAPPAAAIANCEADGLVTIRDELGDLTVAGRDRFARVVAGAVP